MKKYIKKIIKEVLWESKGFIAIEVKKEIIHSMLSEIGIDELRKILDELPQSTNKYTNLTSIFIDRNSRYWLNTYNEELHKNSELSENNFRLKIEIEELKKKYENKTI